MNFLSRSSQEKTEKYDRQLRIWGYQGESHIKQAHILLLGAGSTGSEALKNLVLMGIKEFTVVDQGKVSNYDVANNFFLPFNTVGEPRALVLCHYLKELNLDVKGNSIVSDPIIFVKKNNLAVYQLVIITEQTSQSVIHNFEDKFYHKKIPVVYARTCGFIGVCRLILKSHCSIETKPSASVEDLDIYDPFLELEAFANSLDINNLDNIHYHRIPFCIILLKVKKNWLQSRNNSLPQTFEEKRLFRESIKSFGGKNSIDKKNILEALEYAYISYTPRRIPESVMAILNESKNKLTNLEDSFESYFWVIARALKFFVENEGIGKLPVSGKIPDMTSSTDIYIKLQDIYSAKADHDAKIVFNYVETILKSVESPTNITHEITKFFCKNAYNLHAFQDFSLKSQIMYNKYNRDYINLVTSKEIGDCTSQCPLLWYFTFLASDIFHSKYDRYPGQYLDIHQEQIKSDSIELFEIAQDILRSANIQDIVKINLSHCKEITRYGGVELHTIASVIGGIVSQESIKLITKQFTILNNTYVFNGICCKGDTYTL